MNWLRRLFPPTDELAPMRAGMGAMVLRAIENDCAESGWSVTTYGCKVRGVAVGDWQFTARRIASADTRPKDEDPLGASLASGAVPKADAQPSAKVVNND